MAAIILILPPFFKLSFFLGFINHWKLNHRPVFDTHAGSIAVAFVLFLSVQVFDFFRGFLLLSLVSLRILCDNDPSFKDQMLSASKIVLNTVLIWSRNWADAFSIVHAFVTLVLGGMFLIFFTNYVVVSSCCSMHMLSLAVYHYIRLSEVCNSSYTGDGGIEKASETEKKGSDEASAGGSCKEKSLGLSHSSNSIPMVGAVSARNSAPILSEDEPAAQDHGPCAGLMKETEEEEGASWKKYRASHLTRFKKQLLKHLNPKVWRKQLVLIPANRFNQLLKHLNLKLWRKKLVPTEEEEGDKKPLCFISDLKHTSPLDGVYTKDIIVSDLYEWFYMDRDGNTKDRNRASPANRSKKLLKHLNPKLWGKKLFPMILSLVQDSWKQRRMKKEKKHSTTM